MKLAVYKSGESHIQEAMIRHIELLHLVSADLKLFFKEAERSMLRVTWSSQENGCALSSESQGQWSGLTEPKAATFNTARRIGTKTDIQGRGKILLRIVWTESVRFHFENLRFLRRVQASLHHITLWRQF